MHTIYSVKPAYHPTSLLAKSEKCAYLWHFSTYLVEIWYGVSIHPVKPAYHSTSLKVENMHNFAIFQWIYLKLSMETYSFGRVSDLLVIAILWNW